VNFEYLCETHFFGTCCSLSFCFGAGGYNGTTVLNDFFRFRLKPIGVPPPALVHDLQRLVNDPDLADVRFSVEGRIVYAHKAILAIRSEYFRVMLCGGMRESMMTDTTMNHDDDDDDGIHGADDDDDDKKVSSRSSSTAVIELPDVQYSVFLKVLEFLYTDNLSRDTSLEVGIHLLILSEQFMLDRLKAICEDLIRRDICTETVVSILVASHRHNASGLKEIAFEFILRHLNNTVVMSCLAELKAEPDLLLEIIRRSNLSQGNHQQGGNSNSMHIDQQQIPGAAGPFGVNQDWNGRR
jgi:leucine-zipper-like transcriptional regulator 1